MAVFEYHKAGVSEAQQKKALAYLLAQSTVGKASTGVLSGLAVTQTTTASASVNVGGGAAAVQASTGNGASILVNDTDPQALDVLGANPMGGLPRNDIVAIDQATGGLLLVVGTPNASPTDPAVPTSAVALARIRNVASATTVDTAHIDDLRAFTTLAQPTGTWVSLALGGGATAGTLKYRQRGNTVDLWIDVTSGSFPSGFTQLSATGAIPAAARPSGTPARAVAYVGSGTVMGSVEVLTTGTINAQVQAGTATVVKVAFSYPAG